MSDEKKDFWKRLDKVKAAMLSVQGNPALMPMSPQLHGGGEDGKIWFITSKDSDFAEAVTDGPKDARFVVADNGVGLWADVSGTLSASGDEEVLDDIWSVFAGAWFEGGKEDPDVRLLCFVPDKAAASIGDGNALKFFYEIARAKVTGKTPDAGWQGTLTF